MDTLNTYVLRWLTYLNCRCLSRDRFVLYTLLKTDWWNAFQHTLVTPWPSLQYILCTSALLLFFIAWGGHIFFYTSIYPCLFSPPLWAFASCVRHQVVLSLPFCRSLSCAQKKTFFHWQRRSWLRYNCPSFSLQKGRPHYANLSQILDMQIVALFA